MGFFDKGGGWDWHDAYDWIPGVESGEGRARAQKLSSMRSEIPVPTPGLSPEAEGWMERLRTMQEPGTGWQNTPAWAAMRGEIEQAGRGMGQQSGAGQAARGTLSTGAYGAGMQAQNERQRMTQEATAQAAGSAYQTKVGTDLARFDQGLRAAGFAQGVKDQDFRNEYTAYLAKLGLTQAEIAMEMQELDRAWGMLTGGIQAGISIYDTLTGGAQGRARPGVGPMTASDALIGPELK